MKRNADIRAIEKVIYSPHLTDVVSIDIVAPDMAIIVYTHGFMWHKDEPCFGVAVKDSAAYGNGWHDSVRIYHDYTMAVLRAFGEKYDGLNTQFERFASKMLGIGDNK